MFHNEHLQLLPNSPLSAPTCSGVCFMAQLPLRWHFPSWNRNLHQATVTKSKSLRHRHAGTSRKAAQKRQMLSPTSVATGTDQPQLMGRAGDHTSKERGPKHVTWTVNEYVYTHSHNDVLISLFFWENFRTIRTSFMGRD